MGLPAGETTKKHVAQNDSSPNGHTFSSSDLKNKPNTALEVGCVSISDLTVNLDLKGLNMNCHVSNMYRRKGVNRF